MTNIITIENMKEFKDNMDSTYIKKDNNYAYGSSLRLNFPTAVNGTLTHDLGKTLDKGVYLFSARFGVSAANLQVDNQSVYEIYVNDVKVGVFETICGVNAKNRFFNISVMFNATSSFSSITFKLIAIVNANIAPYAYFPSVIKLPI